MADDIYIVDHLLVLDAVIVKLKWDNNFSSVLSWILSCSVHVVSTMY